MLRYRYATCGLNFRASRRVTMFALIILCNVHIYPSIRPDRCADLLYILYIMYVLCIFTLSRIYIHSVRSTDSFTFANHVQTRIHSFSCYHVDAWSNVGPRTERDLPKWEKFEWLVVSAARAGSYTYQIDSNVRAERYSTCKPAESTTCCRKNT